MKRLAALLALILGVSIVALPQASVFEDVEAAIRWEDGRTGWTLEAGPTGERLTLRRVVAPRLEIRGVSESASPFSLGAKILLVRDLHPLAIAVDLGLDHVSLLSSLFLGPVGIDIGRRWFEGAVRWGFVWLAPHPELSMAVGVEEVAGRVSWVMGLRWCPAWARQWSLSFRGSAAGPRVTVRAWR